MSQHQSETRKPHLCCATVMSRGRAFPKERLCRRYAYVVRGNSWYCHDHDPQEITRREKKQEEGSRNKRRLLRLALAGPAMIQTLREIALSDTITLKEAKLKARMALRSVDPHQVMHIQNSKITSID